MAKLTRKKPGITLSMDKLIDCPCCNSNACYESEFTTQEGKVTTWLCMTCGMTTNTSMTEDSELLKESFDNVNDESVSRFLVLINLRQELKEALDE